MCYLWKQFGGLFWVGSDSIFRDCLWVKMGCGGDESIRHLWKEFRGLLLSGQRLSFPWLFMSQRGCLGWQIHSSPVKVVSGAISKGQRLSFPWLFMSQQGMCGLTNPFVTCESSFRGDFWEGSDHYQKFAKYQRIYRRHISVSNLRSELPMDTFPSVLQSVTTDENFSVRNSVGNYRQKYSVGSYRLNYERKSFRIKKKACRWRGGFGGSFFSDDITDGFKNDSPYSDVTGAPFTLPTDSPRDLKWQIRTLTCLCFRQNQRRDHWLIHRRNIRQWNRR